MNRSRSNYTPISKFGSNEYSSVNNPLTYCIGRNVDQKFLHGSGSEVVDGQSSKACQLYLSEYCANNWNGFCEFISKNNDTDYYPDQIALNSGSAKGLNVGEILIHNTAAKKYLKSMNNCERKREPFDPNVPTSPMISYWVGNNCVPVYAVDPSQIDNDPVMNKILAKPIIAIEILINIFNTMKREKTLEQLRGTKLGYFYSNNPYFKSLGSL